MKIQTNHRFNKKLLLLIGVVSLLCLACNKNDKESETTTRSFNYLDTLNTIPANNPITIEKVNLGKKLFFDPLLSKNKNISCASCHEPALAFSDGVAQSQNGNSKKTLDRNSPAIFNLAWHNDFFWDGGKIGLENQAFGPIRNKDEMAMDLDTLIIRLQAHHTYPYLFQQAFADGLQIENVVRALASYERTLISFSSKYDEYKKGNGTFTTAEKAGQKVFSVNCSSCHTPPLFTDTKFHNNGINGTINEDFEHPSQGKYRVTGKIEDQGKYKTPSLRNLAFTAPYMHDGRFTSIEAILTQYENPKASHTLASELTNGIHLTTQEKEDLIIFLNTLNDYKFISEN